MAVHFKFLTRKTCTDHELISHRILCLKKQAEINLIKAMIPEYDKECNAMQGKHVSEDFQRLEEVNCQRKRHTKFLLLWVEMVNTSTKRIQVSTDRIQKVMSREDRVGC